jgi:hypothetical protein
VHGFLFSVAGFLLRPIFEGRAMAGKESFRTSNLAARRRRGSIRAARR